jgi:uncharacterized protein
LDDSGISNPKFRNFGFEMPALSVPFLLLFMLLGLGVPALAAQDVPIPAAPTQWVTDTAGFLSPADVERLNAELRAYEEQTQHQLLVWIGPTTGQVPIEDWANRAFEKWRVGRKGIDDGLALFIMAKDRRLRIEVGYGLEPKVPDLLASRIIQETIVPRIRSGDNAGAIEEGMRAVTQAIGQPLPGESAPRRVAQSRPVTSGQLGFLAIIAIIVMVVLVASPGFAIWLLVSLLSGGNRGRRGGGGGGGFFGGGFGGGGWSGGGGGGGGGWGGGGGFSGGGGMSGGGGASGSW